MKPVVKLSTSYCPFYTNTALWPIRPWKCWGQRCWWQRSWWSMFLEPPGGAPGPERPDWGAGRGGSGHPSSPWGTRQLQRHWPCCWRVFNCVIHLSCFVMSFQTFLSLLSVTQSRLTLCDPMDCSTPGLPVLHYPPEFTQTHVHQVGDAIQPSRPLSSPSSALNLSQHQGLF